MKVAEIGNKIDEIIKKIGKKMTESVEKEVRKNILDVINTSQQQIKIFTENSMQEQFKNFYGINFSSNILKNLYSISIKNFRPEISYTEEDINIFKSNLDMNSLLDDMDDFVSDMDSLSEEEYYDDELYNEYYGDEDNIEEEFDYNFNQKIKWNSSYYNKTFREGKVPSAKKAFEMAKNNTINDFNIIEKPKLKSYSKKKIGIDIF